MLLNLCWWRSVIWILVNIVIFSIKKECEKYYYIEDNIELFVIHARRIGGFKDFLIFERHVMFSLVTLSTH
jgi:hypothetical protein